MFVSQTVTVVVTKSLCYNSCVLILVCLFCRPAPLLPHPLTSPTLCSSCINQASLSLLKVLPPPIQFLSLICHPTSSYLPQFVVPIWHAFFMLGIFLLPSYLKPLDSACVCSQNVWLPSFLLIHCNGICIYRTSDLEMAQFLCGEAYQCLFDYALSLHRDMAHFTRNYLDSFVNIKAKNMERGNSSQRLIYPTNGTSATPFIIL
jgi:hypothetical protein